MNARRAANVKVLLVAGITCAALAVPSLVFGQSGTSTSCGSIITWIDSSTTSEPIADCDDPFAATTIDEDVVVYTLGTTTIQAGTTMELPELPQTYQLSYQEELDSGLAYTQLYRHRDDDLVQIPDESAVDTQQSRFTFNATGTYSLVHTVPEVFQQVERTPRWLPDWLWPRTAHAQLGTPEVHVTTFEVTLAPPPEPEPEPEPTGASSVLFLPGIMGSRLYEESNACDEDDPVREQERWFSLFECEQLRLQTNFLGDSINDIYTKPTEHAVIDETYGANVYKGVLDQLETWQDEDVITDYRAVPYDWRLKLPDILQTREEGDQVVFDSQSELTDSYVYKNLAELASSSESGSVTVVAHSNGGLLAKQLLYALEATDDPLLDVVDNLVLVGVPQAGTPNALESVLHGSEMVRGYVLSNKTSRQLVNTMPFAYHLLPSEQYFSSTGGLTVHSPIIEIMGGTSTAALRAKHGQVVDSHEQMLTFLAGEDRAKPAIDDLTQPEKADASPLRYHKTAHALQSSWEPHAGLDVWQIAGTGVATPASITYFTDQECVRRSALTFFLCAEHAPTLGHTVRMTQAGDGTVVEPSALAMAGNEQVKRLWLNLSLVNANRIFPMRHADMLEIEHVLDTVSEILQKKELNNSFYVRQARPDFADAQLIFQLHSPLALSVETPEGVVSETTNDVSNATYRRFGETQFVSVPAGSDVEVALTGEAYGSFTLQAERWEGDELQAGIDFTGIPSATNTVATLELGETLEDSTLLVDYDGDGQEEVQYTTDEEYELLVDTRGTGTTSEELKSEETEKEIEEEKETSDAETENRSNIGTRVEDRKPPGRVAGITTDPTLNLEMREQLLIALQELSDVLVIIEENHL